MIQVTQRNTKGNIQFLTMSEIEFASRYSEDDVKRTFSVSDIELRREHVDIYTVRVYFAKVATTGTGKILPVDYLVGLVRKYRKAWRAQGLYYSSLRERWVQNNRDTSPGRHPGRKWRWRGSYHKPMHTTQERRWANAWDDDEFAPKVRARRNAGNLPNTWDDYPRYDYRNNNWKRYRKHQWKEKKGG